MRPRLATNKLRFAPLIASTHVELSGLHLVNGTMDGFLYPSGCVDVSASGSLTMTGCVLQHCRSFAGGALATSSDGEVALYHLYEVVALT